MDLSQYIGKKEAKITLSFVPEDRSAIEMVTVSALLSIRPTTSKVTTNPIFDPDDEILP